MQPGFLRILHASHKLYYVNYEIGLSNGSPTRRQWLYFQGLPFYALWFLLLFSGYS